MSEQEPIYKTYRKKPITIEAAETGIDFDRDLAIMEWCGGQFPPEDSEDDYLFVIPTLEGVMGFTQGAFIIRGIQGEFYPCDRTIFEASYEQA
jgi:hypothetical protein